MPDELTSIEPHEFAESVVALISDSDEDTPVGTDAADTVEETPAAEGTGEGTAGAEEPEIVEDEHGNLRDVKTGKFVSKDGKELPDQDVESDGSGEGVQPEEWELDIDPDIEAFLAKYDGDLNKALRGAVEASRTIGRQGSEIGELRQLQGKIETLEQMVAAQTTRSSQPNIDFESLIDEDPKRAAHVAMKQGNVEAMMAAVNAWADSGEPRDAFEASTFLNEVMRGFEMDQLRQEFASAQPQAAATNDEQEVAKVLTKHPDLEQFLPAIGEVAKERPLLRAALFNGTPEQKADALEMCYEIARSRQGVDTSEAVRRARVRVAGESAQARADAAVVSASRGSAASADQPTGVDQFHDAFDKHLRDRGLMGSEES